MTPRISFLAGGGAVAALVLVGVAVRTPTPAPAPVAVVAPAHGQLAMRFQPVLDGIGSTRALSPVRLDDAIGAVPARAVSAQVEGTEATPLGSGRHERARAQR